MAKDSEGTRRSLFTLKGLSSWSLKLLGILIPAVVASYFSYRQAIFESQLGSASTKNQAQAGYTTLVEVIEKSTRAIDEISKETARLEGRLMSMEARLNSSSPSPATPQPQPVLRPIGGLGSGGGGLGSGRGSVSGVTGVSVTIGSGSSNGSEIKKIFKPLPKTLDEAMQVQTKR